MTLHEHRTFRLTAAIAATGLIGTGLLLGGCDSDGAGVADAGHDGDHTDTALVSSLPQPTPAETQPQPTPAAPQPTPAAPQQTTAATQETTIADFGSYRVPLADATLTCDFSGDPEANGYAWACEAPVHLGWQSTNGGEANSVAYRPGRDPEVFAVLGNSGIPQAADLPAAVPSVTSIGGRYTVDTSAHDAVTITDLTTGVALQLTAGGYTTL